MVKSLQFMLNRREETYKIAQAEFNHPRDVTEGAANICIKAIDPRNPGGASDESMRNNIDLTITQPLKLRRDRRWPSWSTFLAAGKFSASWAFETK